MHEHLKRTRLSARCFELYEQWFPTRNPEDAVWITGIPWCYEFRRANA
nr:MAG TPA: hypothetical protein [Caudoviricetes sp.]